ncbi:hypothetical protein BDQ17DRAFT_1236208 [Cyathus striatus]|nr:hypothetical protein BDQ17DRAFT_1236208 [Cyathus striatus]
MPEQSNPNGTLSPSLPPRPSSSLQRDPSPAKLSPIAPLAPLEYLQNQRRGSITDPSLHAAPLASAAKHTAPYRSPEQPSSTSSSSTPFHDISAKASILNDPRPSSPYVFGDATAQAIHPADTNAQLRKLLRSPSLDHSSRRSPPILSRDLPGASRNVSGSSSKELAPMNVDVHRQNDRRIPQPSFDYSMRRHSVAGIAGIHNSHTLPHLSSLSHGTKRKMSGDRGVFPPVGEEIDPQLIGPGVPSGMDVDTDAPAPKRRGSTFDTRPMARLSINDRRNSTDTRPGLPQLWQNDRRDSTSSIFSTTTNVSGLNSVFSASDSPRGQQNVSGYSWQGNSQASDTSSTPGISSHETESSNFHPSRSSEHNSNLGTMMPPLNLAPDRRMSVPDALVSAGPTRALRSRSRPPSRQMQHAESNLHSTPSSGQEDSGTSTVGGKTLKEPGSTPYSRSPELRVSHKLAERKRRKEMKDLFDELRDQLPADRGMKASKWEILSKAIDFVCQLKQSHQDMAREIDMLRHEVDTLRQGGNPPFGLPSHQVLYGQVAPVPGQFPPPSTVMHPPPGMQGIHAASRPGSSQNAFAPGVEGNAASQNGSGGRGEVGQST